VSRLSAESLAASITHVRVLSVTASTNDEARRWAGEGAPHGAVVVADHQTAGRGRLGRAWEAPPGANVLMSIVLRRGLDPARLGLVSLATAVAVVAALPATPRWQIKWPNDVVSPDGHKLGGILAEAEWSAGVPQFVVVGVGLNVGAHPPDLPATSLAAWGDPPPRERLIADLASGISSWAAAPAEQIRASWTERAALTGRRVEVGGRSGVALGIGPDGALRVRDDDGVVHEVRAGEVTTPVRW
jgi:BirA family transcriptional regulator, biotin operon repressor / biotin---[acetyl-CoA-carboxylase] ligase